MTRELVELCDEQDTFNNLVDMLGSVGEAVNLLLNLEADTEKLKGAIYGWALREAGL